jgi:hypothetical protein
MHRTRNLKVREEMYGKRYSLHERTRMTHKYSHESFERLDLRELSIISDLIRELCHDHLPSTSTKDRRSFPAPVFRRKVTLALDATMTQRDHMNWTISQWFSLSLKRAESRCYRADHWQLTLLSP